MQASLYDLSTPQTGRGLSAALWRQSLQCYVGNDPLYGVRIKDDFVESISTTGSTSANADRGWSTADAATAGGTHSISSVAGPNGVARLNSSGTSNQNGAELQYSNACVVLPTHASDPNGRTVFQARIDPSDADTIFVGLSEAGDNFLSSSSQLPSADYIGFYTEDGGTTLKFVCNEPDSGSAHSATLPVSLETGFNNVGFAVNRDKSVDVVVNGVWLGTVGRAVPQASLPNETLTIRVSATAGGGTTAPTVDIDSIDCFVEA